MRLIDSGIIVQLLAVSLREREEALEIIIILLWCEAGEIALLPSPVLVEKESGRIGFELWGIQGGGAVGEK